MKENKKIYTDSSPILKSYYLLKALLAMLLLRVPTKKNLFHQDFREIYRSFYDAL